MPLERWNIIVAFFNIWNKYLILNTKLHLLLFFPLSNILIMYFFPLNIYTQSIEYLWKCCKKKLLNQNATS